MEKDQIFVFSVNHLVVIINVLIGVSLFFIKRYLDKIDKRIDDIDELEIKILLAAQDIEYIKKNCDRTHYKNGA